MMTLASLKNALQEPFAPETIQFLPKEVRRDKGKLICLALPYANKRVYEDRLNELAYGEWNTPYTVPYSSENKLIIPVTVVICGVPHTDYGEAFLTRAGKDGTVQEDKNTATGAYSQAFRRACAKFLLGRYLYDLPKLWLPYDKGQIDLSQGEKLARVEMLYAECGLIKPRGSKRSTANGQGSTTPAGAIATVSTTQQNVPTHSTAAATPQQNVSKPPVAPAPQKAQVQPTTAATVSVSQPTAKTESRPLPSHSTFQRQAQPAFYNDTFLDWVAAQVDRDPVRIQGICAFYQVAALAQLSTEQREELTRRLRQQASAKRANPEMATAILSV